MPVFTIETPTGVKLDIEANDEQAALAGAQEWHQQNSTDIQQPKVGVGEDIAKAAPGAAVGGLSNAIGLPGSISQLNTLAAKGIAWAGGKLLGYKPEDIAKVQELLADSGEKERTFATPAEIKKGIEKDVTGPLYEAQTPVGKVASKTLETVTNPVSYAGPGGALLKLAGAAGAGAGGEVARQAAEGTGYEVPAEIAGSLVGGGLPLAAARPRAPAAIPAPSAPMIDLAADSAYARGGSIDAAIHPQVVQQTAQQARAAIRAARSNETLSPTTHGVIDRLEGSAASGELDMPSLHMLRKEINQARAAGGEDSAMAAILGQHVDDMVDQLAARRAYTTMQTGPLAGQRVGGSPVTRGSVADVQEAMRNFRRADTDYTAARHSDMITGREANGALNAAKQHSGMNLDNNLRDQIAGILKSETLSRGFTQQELGLMHEIVEGTASQNAIRQIGNRLGGGGGIAGTMLAAIGAAAAGPIGALAGVAGLGVRAAANHNTQRKVQALDAMIRMRSGLGQQIVQPTRQVLPNSVIAAQLLRALASGQPLN